MTKLVTLTNQNTGIRGLGGLLKTLQQQSVSVSYSWTWYSDDVFVEEPCELFRNTSKSETGPPQIKNTQRPNNSLTNA